MSLEELKREVAKLPEDELDQLASHIRLLSGENRQRVRESIARAARDRHDPTKWISYEEFQRRLAVQDNEA